jgi:hypothetical protein
MLNHRLQLPGLNSGVREANTILQDEIVFAA